MNIKKATHSQLSTNESKKEKQQRNMAQMKEQNKTPEKELKCNKEKSTGTQQWREGSWDSN